MNDRLVVSVDRGLCENHGQCVFAAPAVFAFDDDENLVYESRPAGAERDRVWTAAVACPVQAIAWSEGT